MSQNDLLSNPIGLLEQTLVEANNMEEFVLLYYKRPHIARQFRVRHMTSFKGVWNPYQGYLTTGNDIVHALDNGWTTVARYLTRIRQAKAKCYQDIAFYKSNGKTPSAVWWSR